MKLLGVFSLVLSFLVLSGCGKKTEPVTIQPPYIMAAQSVDGFLNKMDEGKYQNAAKDFSTANNSLTTPKITEMLSNSRTPFGVLISRDMVRMTKATRIGNSPVGTYFILEFRSNFANRQNVAESVYAMLDKDNKWRIAGYTPVAQ